MRRHLAMLLVSVVAFAGISTVSQAADQLVTKAKRVVTKAPPPSGSTGFYVGINGGYDWGRATFSNFLGASTSINVPSGMAGLTFGYNAQSGSFVYGLETDIDAAWLSNTNWGVPPCFACIRLWFPRRKLRRLLGSCTHRCAKASWITVKPTGTDGIPVLPLHFRSGDGGCDRD